MKKIVALVLSVVIMLTFLTACQSSENKQTLVNKNDNLSFTTEYTNTKNVEFVPCAESGNLKLSFQPSTTQLKVENSADGSVWYSNPLNPQDDVNASQLVKMRMMSLLDIEYVNTSTKKRTVINTYTACVKSGKYEIYTSENGVMFKYNVAEVGKTVFLAVFLEKENLVTKLWYEALKEEKEDIEITSIAPLPYMIRGSIEDNGYLFLPDGSGATVDFSDIVYSGNPYSRNIYGFEPTLITSDYYLDVAKNSVYLPVYGAKVNESAIMAICENGAEYGVLTAEACGQSSSYARAYVNYKLLNSVEYKVGNYSTELFDTVDSSLQNITTRYLFLSGDDADYSGMARKYRDYLSDGSNYKKTSTGLYTDIYASVIKKSSTAGIPHNKTILLTDEAQLKSIVDKLNNEGVKDITVRYRQWNSDEISGSKVNTATSSSGISLKKISSIKNAKIYPAILNLQTYSNGGYLDRLFNASKSITQLPFSWKEYQLSNLNETKNAEYRVSVDWFRENSKKLINRLKAKDISNVAFGDISNSLYCDFKGEGFKRDSTLLVMKEFIKQSKESFNSLMLDSANAYAAVYADVIYNTPIDHSNHDILSNSVPFYTIAMSGIADCVAPAYNSGDNDKNVLYTVASGASLCVSWMAANTTELVGTELSGLSNVNFSETVDECLELYKKIDKVYSGINGSLIYSHHYINDDVSVTEYDNGLEIYVNFGKEPFLMEDGTEIPAEDFVAKEGKQ